MPEFPKTYDPRSVEDDIYRRWEGSGFFNPDKLPNAKKRKPFVISMPPPNITGELHLGHALGMTIEDVFIRFERMRGRAALYLPGTDHAAIATQVVVERELKKSGRDRTTMGREKFLAEVWKWKETYGSRIIEQTKRMGASADWSRQRFTMDEGMSKAVQTAFLRLYRDKLLYRGQRIVNWCPECQTSVSDLEVDHEQTPGTLWYIRYRLADEPGEVIVATTRPETLLGDTAIAVNPNDERYTKLIGKKIRVPICGREVPIIADHRVEKNFGTGAVKVTPAHDAFDYELGQTHALSMVTVIGFDGCMTTEAGAEIAGHPTAQARQIVLQKLREQDALVKEEDYVHPVLTCSRSKTIIQPLLSLQWFIKTKPLAEKALAAVKNGKVKIVPDRYEKVYYHWLENIRDWNISRQIWWGHRLPVWYKMVKGKEKMKVSVTSPGEGWHQDTDTLDTWFSSGLWTFSTLGWPKKTKDLQRFHPTDILETGWDILFFWVARMMMLSLYFQKEVPFKTIYLHGLVLDKDGKKMSKSKGTGIDPLPTADTYGMDALRMSLIIGNAPGQDFRLYEQKVEGYRNFANKLWNIARYISQQPISPVTELSDGDQWISARLDEVITTVTQQIEKHNLSAAGQALYDFVWHDLADWYIEYGKMTPNSALAHQVLETTLKLLHPFMPFVTEAIWSQLGKDGLLLAASWPTASSTPGNDGVKRFTDLQQTVVGLRSLKTATTLTSSDIGEVVANESEVKIMSFLSRVPLRAVDRLAIGGGGAQLSFGSHSFTFPERVVSGYTAWQEKERAELKKFITLVENKLSSPTFVERAPAGVVEEERKKLVAAKERLLQVG